MAKKQKTYIQVEIIRRVGNVLIAELMQEPPRDFLYGIYSKGSTIKINLDYVRSVKFGVTVEFDIRWANLVYYDKTNPHDFLMDAVRK